jgi:hypothetical protein
MRESLIVSYDLVSGDDSSSRYEPLIAAIKGYGYWGKLMLSTWIVVTEDSAAVVRDRLTPFLDSNDRIFVAPVGKPAAWRNVQARDAWMKERP